MSLLSDSQDAKKYKRMLERQRKSTSSYRKRQKEQGKCQLTLMVAESRKDAIRSLVKAIEHDDLLDFSLSKVVVDSRGKPSWRRRWQCLLSKTLDPLEDIETERDAGNVLIIPS
ncbi:MAG: hypothetical protein HY795_15720 [Desulfovibrio sp.]|nr:hypothetical protein [Desulfovibrio sp.]MBI4958730.1 hypothetical protein [Desulfovibrio sp.]